MLFNSYMLYFFFSLFLFEFSFVKKFSFMLFSNFFSIYNMTFVFILLFFCFICFFLIFMQSSFLMRVKDKKCYVKIREVNDYVNCLFIMGFSLFFVIIMSLAFNISISDFYEFFGSFKGFDFGDVMPNLSSFGTLLHNEHFFNFLVWVFSGCYIVPTLCVVIFSYIFLKFFFHEGMLDLCGSSYYIVDSKLPKGKVITYVAGSLSKLIFFSDFIDSIGFLIFFCLLFFVFVPLLFLYWDLMTTYWVDDAQMMMAKFVQFMVKLSDTPNLRLGWSYVVACTFYSGQICHGIMTTYGLILFSNMFFFLVFFSLNIFFYILFSLIYWFESYFHDKNLKLSKVHHLDVTNFANNSMGISLALYVMYFFVYLFLFSLDIFFVILPFLVILSAFLLLVIFVNLVIITLLLLKFIIIIIIIIIIQFYSVCFIIIIVVIGELLFKLDFKDGWHEVSKVRNYHFKLMDSLVSSLTIFISFGFCYFKSVNIFYLSWLSYFFNKFFDCLGFYKDSSKYFDVE